METECGARARARVQDLLELLNLHFEDIYSLAELGDVLVLLCQAIFLKGPSSDVRDASRRVR